MQDNKNITPINDKGEPHGYWEVYCNDTIWYKCFFVNGVVYGYKLFITPNYSRISYITR